MNFTGNSSGHQRLNTNNSSHHRANNNSNGTILEDEEYTEHGYDSDDNTVVTDVSSIIPGGGGSRNGSDRGVVGKSDLLTIFQAAPLAGMVGTKLSPIGELNLEEERTQVSRIFRRTQVAVDFKIATHDALGTFLAEDKGRILHFSCHGDAGSLFLEGDWGGLAPLDKDNLKRWIQLGGRELQFVFVSACYSQSIGQAFVDAGVPHVVCSKANAKLRVGVSALFEKTFYRNLARKKTVQKAFDIAKEATLADPKIPEEYRREEVEKYCLLGRANHNVPVFFQRNINVVSQPPRRPPEGFTPPPKEFIGRSIDQYLILKKLQHSRLTCIHGPSGMGKTSLVKAVCQYVHYRFHMMDFSDIQWIDTSPNRLSRSEEHLQPLLDLIHSSTLEPSNFVEQAWEPILQLVETFRRRKTLLVVDAKHISDKVAVRKLGIFLDELIKATRHVKVIVIYNEEDSIEACCLSVEHQTYAVGPLSFEWSARLFSRLCPEKLLHENHYGIGTSQQLCEMLLQSSSAEPNMDNTIPRIRMLWDMVGGGDPRRTVDVAKYFTRQQYLDLLTLSANKDDIDLTLEKLLQLESKIDEIEKRREIYERRSDEQNIAACSRRLNELERQREVYSRASLERRQEKLHTEYEAARKEDKLLEAQELKHKQEQLALIIEQLPTLIWLENRREELEFEFKLAKHKDNLQAWHLHKELKRTIAAIAAERNSFSDTDIPVSRASLEAKIIQLEAEKKTAVTCCDFAKARELKPEIYRLKQMQSIVPSAEELRRRILSLESSLKKAVDEEDYDSAETLFHRLEEIRAKLRAEEEAEKSYGIQVASAILPMTNVQSVYSSVARQAAMDPGDEQSVGSSIARRAAVDPGDDAITSTAHSTTSSDPPGLAVRTDSRRSHTMLEGKKGSRDRYSSSSLSLMPPARNALQTIIPSTYEVTNSQPINEEPISPLVHAESAVTKRFSNQGLRSRQASRRPDQSETPSMLEPGAGPGAYAVGGNSSTSNGDDENDAAPTLSVEEIAPTSHVPQSAALQRDIELPIMATSMEIVNDVMEDQERLEQRVVQIMRKHAVQAEVVPAPPSHNREISVDFSEYRTSSRDTESLRDSLNNEEKKGGMKAIFKKLRNKTGKK